MSQDRLTMAYPDIDPPKDSVAEVILVSEREEDRSE